MTGATRRQLLAAGAAIGAASTAGCFDFDFEVGDVPDDADEPADEDDTADDEPENDDPAGEMRLSGIEYTTDRATGFGEYTVQPDAEYDRDAMVWLYIELENVTPQEGPELETEWTVTDPVGDEVAAVTEPVAVAELEPLPNEAFLTQGLDGSFFGDRPGEYTLTVRIEDRGSGVERVATTTFTLVGFGFYMLTMTETEPRGIDRYDRRTEPYEQGDDVWVYIETTDHEIDDTDTARLKYEITITDPDDEPWATVEDEEVWEEAADTYLAIWRGFDTDADDTLGEYTVTVTVTDDIGGETITDQVIFDIGAEGD